jgi:hypothetical protein
MPLALVARVVAAVAIVLGSSWALLSNNETGNDQHTERAIDVEGKGEHPDRIDVRVDRGSPTAGNPDESSFGTLQEDGTYCGVTCAENH